MAKKKGNLGRPTVMTPEMISKLEKGFMMGFTDVEACLFADVAPSTLYEYCKSHPDFSERKEMLKKHPTMKAKAVIIDRIQKKDKQSAQWYLERKARDEFSTKVEQHNTGEINIVKIDEDDENL